MFEKVILKDNAKSRTYLNQFKAEILKISSDESNDMFTRIGPVLKHVYSATNAYLMSLTSDLQLEETAKKVRRLNLLQYCILTFNVRPLEFGGHIFW